jgi:hypothetical protein
MVTGGHSRSDPSLSADLAAAIWPGAALSRIVPYGAGPLLSQVLST